MQSRASPIHQGSLRLQGQTGFHDCQGSCHEEVEGGIELSLSVISEALYHLDKFWWAVSSNLFDTILYRSFLLTTWWEWQQFHKQKKRLALHSAVVDQSLMICYCVFAPKNVDDHACPSRILCHLLCWYCCVHRCQSKSCKHGNYERVCMSGMVPLIELLF